MRRKISFFVQVGILFLSFAIECVRSAASPNVSPAIIPSDHKRDDDTNWIDETQHPEKHSRKERWWKSIPSWIASRLLPSETRRALGTVTTILSRLHQEHGVVDLLRLYKKHQVLTAMAALNRLQSAARRYEHLHDNVHDGTHASKELLQELAHYAVYANAAYGWKMDLALRRKFSRGGSIASLIRKTGIQYEDVVVAKWESRVNRPAYFIARDHHHKAIVLSVRGTMSFHDLLTDLCCTHKEFNATANLSTVTEQLRKGRIYSALHISAGDMYDKAVKRKRSGHVGMLDAARALQDDAEPTLTKELRLHPNYSLVLIGHSLGGGVASLLATLLERKVPSLKVYTYGPPCVAPEHAKLHNNIVSVIGEGDPMSVLSLGHLADLSVALSRICEDSLLRHEILLRTNKHESKMDDRDLEWCFDTMETLRREDMNAEKLFPPGRLLLMSKSNESGPKQWDLRTMSHHYFRDILLRPQQFDISKHIPSLYESRLRDILVQME